VIAGPCSPPAARCPFNRVRPAPERPRSPSRAGRRSRGQTLAG
jgi:hypothetical protein